MAAAQDLPEPAASDEKDQMGLASLPGRPPASFPLATGADTDPRLPVQASEGACRTQKSVPAESSLVTWEEGAEVGTGRARNILSSGPRIRSQQTVLPFLPQPWTLDIRVWLWSLRPVRGP